MDSAQQNWRWYECWENDCWGVLAWSPWDTFAEPPSANMSMHIVIHWTCFWKTNQNSKILNHLYPNTNHKNILSITGQIKILTARGSWIYILWTPKLQYKSRAQPPFWPWLLIELYRLFVQTNLLSKYHHKKHQSRITVEETWLGQRKPNWRWISDEEWSVPLFLWGMCCTVALKVVAQIEDVVP